MNFKLHYCGSKIVEQGDFTINRPEGSPRFILFHFYSTVKITIDKQIINATPGSMILYAPKTPQLFESDTMRINHDYIDFDCFDESIIEELKIPLNEILTPTNSKDLSDLFKDIYEYYRNPIQLDAVLDYKILGLFIKLSESIHHKKIGIDTHYINDLKNKFEDLRYDMYQNPAKLTVKELAKKANFSLSYFNVLYKHFFFVNPIKDLDNARLKKVQRELLDGTKSSEIIKELGFATEEYFYSWFKKHTGMTIKEYIYKENEEKLYD